MSLEILIGSSPRLIPQAPPTFSVHVLRKAGQGTGTQNHVIFVYKVLLAHFSQFMVDNYNLTNTTSCIKNIMHTLYPAARPPASAMFSARVLCPSNWCNIQKSSIRKMGNLKVSVYIASYYHSRTRYQEVHYIYRRLLRVCTMSNNT